MVTLTSFLSSQLPPDTVQTAKLLMVALTLSFLCFLSSPYSRRPTRFTPRSSWWSRWPFLPLTFFPLRTAAAWHGSHCEVLDGCVDLYYPFPCSVRQTRSALQSSWWLCLLTFSFLSPQPPPDTVHTAKFLMVALTFSFLSPQPPPEKVHTAKFLMVALTFSFLSQQPPPGTVHTAGINGWHYTSSPFISYPVISSRSFRPLIHFIPGHFVPLS
jgi:hypothetical protein